MTFCRTRHAPPHARWRLLGLCLAVALVAGGTRPAAAQSSAASSVFPDPNAAVTVRPATSSPFPDPNAGRTASQSGSSVFPDPNTGQRGAPIAPASPFPAPPGAGGGFGAPPPAAAPGGPSADVQQACVREFDSLRDERDNRGKAIQAAMTAKQKPGPDVACKLFRSFSSAEAKMLQFLKTKSARCGIPGEIAGQLAKGHAQTEKTTNQICTAAAQPRGPAAPTLSDVLGGPALPDATTERKTGGSTFDTINGNVLAR